MKPQSSVFEDLNDVKKSYPTSRNQDYDSQFSPIIKRYIHVLCYGNLKGFPRWVDNIFIPY